MAVRHLAASGFGTIYIRRHEENRASAGMMKKAGFRVVKIVHEPNVRPNGNQKTAVCRLVVPEGGLPKPKPRRRRRRRRRS